MFKFFKRGFFSFFSNDLAIDLGTANTVIYVPKKGIILNEPSVVAVKADVNTVLAAGQRAKEMLGKTPDSIIASRPLREGVIADFQMAESMIRYFIKKVNGNRRTIAKPRMVIGVPSGITQVEKRAVEDTAKQAGASEVYIITEPLAAAIGAGLPVHEPNGSMIVDIGGGTTEVAVISLKNMVYCQSIRIGGDAMDQAIINFIKKEHNLLIGERTAEKIKIEIGTATPVKNEQTLAVKGRDLISGVPKIVKLTSSEINKALQETIEKIVDGIKIALENTPPELSSDLVDSGIMLAGGGSLLQNLDSLIAKETGLPVHVSDDALFCVVNGAGKVLENLDFFKESLFTK